MFLFYRAWLIESDKTYSKELDVTSLSSSNVNINVFTNVSVVLFSSTKIASVVIGEFNEKDDLYDPFEHRDKKNANS